MDPLQQHANELADPYGDARLLADSGAQANFCASTLADENAHGGWSRKDRPVPEIPAKAMTAGSRGADDTSASGEADYSTQIRY